jgi:enoyl-CoA hydratase
MGEIASFESPVLSLEVEDTVATVWLDRPEARNAMGVDLWRDLPRAMEAVSGDSSVRVVVVAAKGPHFSVGLDLKAMGDMLTGGGSQPEPGGEGRPASPADKGR